MNTVHRLDMVCELIMGQAPDGSAYNTDGDGWPLIAGAGDFGEGIPAPSKFTREASKLSKAGDIVLGIRASIGEKVLADRVYCLGRGVAALRAKPSIDNRFLWHWLTCATPELASKARGATFKQVNREDIGELEISYPPLPEQRRIAAILDQADALRTMRRAALAKLDTLAQSVFIEMFGDPEASGWPIGTIEEITDPTRGSIRTGPFGSQLLHSEFTGDGIAVLGIDNAVANEFRWGDRRFISDAKYQELLRYTVRPGDVLITIMGTCGRCAVVPDDIPTAINTKHLCCITLDRSKCLPDFLHAFFLIHPLARRHLEQTAKGAIMDGLNMGLIKSMPIPLVPLALQREYQRKVTSLRGNQAVQRGSLSGLDSLFSSLQHRAFRGEL